MLLNTIALKNLVQQTKNKQNGNKQQSKPKEPVQSVTDDETKALIEQYADELYSDEMNFDPKGLNYSKRKFSLKNT